MKRDARLTIRIPKEIRAWLERAAKKTNNGATLSDIAVLHLNAAYERRNAK